MRERVTGKRRTPSPRGSGLSIPKEEGRLPFERGSIAAIAARRRWRLFGKHEDAEESAEPPSDDGRPLLLHSMLGTLASQGPDLVAEPERRSLLSLGSPAEPADPEQEPVVAPLAAHSTLGELAGLEERSSGSFPIERGILISLFVHLLLVVVLITLPTHVPADPKGGLLAGLVPQDRDDSPIPVIFQESPGPSRQNPKQSPLSDADRRAGGGDVSRPKSDSPFVPPSRGIAGLAPGPKAPRIPGTDVPARQGATAEAERRAAAESAPAADPNAVGLPATARRDGTTGPREVTKLAGLERAIREAARGTVGGEGGSPSPNPDGGFVDSGPLSFDTTWYDWGPYAAEMVRRIKLHWDVPELARLGWKGKLTVRFFILADGRVADARIVRGSGIPPFDFAAFQAIIKSSPFRPLPADLHEDREGVTVTFFYNMRPESEEAKGTN